MNKFRVVTRNNTWNSFYVFPAVVLCLGSPGIGFAFLWWGIEIYFSAGDKDEAA